MAEIPVSAAERDDAVAALSVHRDAGRLSLVDFQQRCRAARAAQTRQQLEALFDDLPEPYPDLGAASCAEPESPAWSRPPPVHPEWPGGRVSTRASRAMDVVVALSLLLGLPGAIVLTVLTGQWWTVVAVVVVAAAAMVLGVVLMDDPNR